MKAVELRQKYLDFFRKNGHSIIRSAPLIPDNDPTVLFTTAGMHPLVPYLLGEKHPQGNRLTDVQKCIRTGDIDNIQAKGELMLGGVPWSARSTNGDPIPAGTLVRVDRIEGVRLFVSPAEVKSEV